MSLLSKHIEPMPIVEQFEPELQPRHHHISSASSTCSDDDIFTNSDEYSAEDERLEVGVVSFGSMNNSGTALSTQ